MALALREAVLTGVNALVDATVGQTSKIKKKELDSNDFDPMSFVFSLALIGASNMAYPKFSKIPGGVIPHGRSEVTLLNIPIPTATCREFVRGTMRSMSDDGHEDLATFEKLIPIANRIFPVDQVQVMSQIWYFANKGLQVAMSTSYPEKGNDTLKNINSIIEGILAKKGMPIDEKKNDIRPAALAANGAGDIVAAAEPPAVNPLNPANNEISERNESWESIAMEPLGRSTVKFEFFSCKLKEMVWSQEKLNDVASKLKQIWEQTDKFSKETLVNYVRRQIELQSIAYQKMQNVYRCEEFTFNEVS